MASMTIRNIDENLKGRLRIRAATNGRSMEEEARDILRFTLSSTAPTSSPNLAEAIMARFAPFGGVELPVIPREPMRDPPTFDE